MLFHILIYYLIMFVTMYIWARVNGRNHDNDLIAAGLWPAVFLVAIIIRIRSEIGENEWDRIKSLSLDFAQVSLVHWTVVYAYKAVT